MERLRSWQNLLGALVLAVALVGSVALVAGLQWDEDEGALVGAMGAARERFGWIIASRATIEQGGLAIQGAVDVDSTLNVDGAATLNSTFDVDGATTLNSTLDVDGATTLNGSLDVDGNLTSGTGAVTITDQVLIDGAADVVQLTAQGYTTQTSSLLVAEQSDGTDVMSLSNAGNMTLAGLLNVGGTLTVTDRVFIDGAADAIQLHVQGYTTQTSSLAVFEQSDGTDVMSLSNAGAMVLAGGLSVTSGGATITAGGITIADGDATMADDFIVSAQTAITATNGGVITPTGTYQPLTSAGTVTPTVTTSGVTTGTLLVLINTSATTINLADSGTMMLTTAAALGQYDSLTLWFDGTNWIEISRADN